MSLNADSCAVTDSSLRQRPALNRVAISFNVADFTRRSHCTCDPQPTRIHMRGTRDRIERDGALRTSHVRDY